jgi:Flp pilus assembly pilin Flp
MPSRRAARSRAGQSTVEYFLVIAVIVVAMVAVAYSFVDPFSDGYEAMREDARTVLTSGTQDGSGNRR